MQRSIECRAVGRGLIVKTCLEKKKKHLVSPSGTRMKPSLSKKSLNYVESLKVGRPETTK